jgi:hypothetical protein
MPFSVEQTLELIPPTWTNLISSPDLVFTNLHYQAELPVAGPRAFYRLSGAHP